MDIIEQIGSYAGLAAIVGLAVLSALYFSQARDLRRLRESEEAINAGAGANQPVAAPGPRRPTAAVVPGQSTAAAAAPQGGQPAEAPTVARPAPVAAQSGAAGEEDGRAAPVASEQTAPTSNRETAPAGAAQAPPEGQGGPTPGPGGNAAGRPARPPAPRLPTPRPGATAAALRSASAPSSTGAKRRWYRRLQPRYLALIIAGVVVVSAGAVYAVTSLVAEGADDSSAEVAGAAAGAEGDAAVPLDPSTITVAVLNGTDVAGLAAQVADTVESAGFQRGNVANATEQASAESAVLYADGARRAARQVGQELDIPQIEPIDEQSQALAGTADVVVIVGADQAE